VSQDTLVSGRDGLLVAIPFVLILLVSILRLDYLFATPKGSVNRRQQVCGMDESGEPILLDPDGRVSGPGRHNKSVGAPTESGMNGQAGIK
jgi:hypothetical protein